MENMKTIDVPDENPAPGPKIHWMKIDTDPDSNLVLALTNFTQGLPQQRATILSVTRTQFDANTWGYLIVYQQ